MNNFTIKKVLVIIALAIMPISMIAQEEKNETFIQNPANYWFIDVDGGGTVLVGDNKPLQFSRMRFNGRLGAGYNFCKHFQAYAKFERGFLAGDYGENWKNKCDYFAYDLNISVDLVSLFGGYKKGEPFGLRLHAGVGQIQYKSTATLKNGTTYWYGYKDSADGYKGKGISGRKVAFELPIGLMFNYNVSRIIDVYLDFTGVFCDTDALDGYKHGKYHDFYGTGNVGVRFKFVKKQPKQIEEKPVAEEVVTKPVTEEVIAEPVAEEVVKPVAEEVVKPVVEKQPVRSERKFVLMFTYGTDIENETNEKVVSDFINSTNNAKIESVKLVGYASPEGKNDFNNNIAFERSKVAKEYLTKKLGSKVDGVIFELAGEGADWDNFLKAVWGSNIKDKEMVITKLNSSKYKAGTLWLLANDNPKLRDLYPDLRRVEATVTVVE